MSLTGEPNGEPLRIGNPSVDLGAAAYTTIEVLGSLLEREKSGKGAFVEVPLLDMSVYWNGYWISFYGITGTMPQRLGSGHLGYSPHKVFVANDGTPVFIAALSDEQWKTLSGLLKISLGGEFSKMQHRLTHRKIVEDAVGNAVSKYNFEDLARLLDEKVPWAPVNSIKDIYNDTELLKRGVLRHLVPGKIHQVLSSPYRFLRESKRQSR